MNKFLTICLAALLSAPFLLSAQSVDVSLSNKFLLKDLDVCPIKGPTYRIGDFFYSVDLDWNHQLGYIAKLDKIRCAIIFHQYDHQMLEVKSSYFRTKGKEFGPFAPKVVLFHGQLLLFYYGVRDQSVELSMAVIDPETLGETSHIDLYNIVERNVGMFNIKGAIDQNKLILAPSPDSSRLLVVQSGNTDEIFTCTINEKLEVERPLTSRFRQGMEDMAFFDGFIGNEGNRYISYAYKIDKAARSGVLFQKEGMKETYLDVKQGPDFESVDKPRFMLSQNGADLYLYATSFLDEVGCGYVLAKIDAGRQKIDQVSYFRFPAEVNTWLHKEGFRQSSGDQNDYYSIATPLKDGSLVISGYPLHTTYNPAMKDYMFLPYAGPIINAFVRGGTANFCVIYRIQERSEASGIVAVPMGDHLDLLYNDGEKNILSTEPTGNRKTYPLRELVLAEAVVGSDGKLISKSKVAVRDADGNFFLSLAQRVSDMHFLVPIGEENNSKIHYDPLTKQWADVDVY